MKNKQTGFTLIEILMVIVIIGILSAIALPRYINLTSEASTSTAAQLANGITSASTINYTARKASNGTKGVAFNFATPCTAANLNTILAAPISTTNFTIADSGTPVDCSAPANDGITGACSVTPINGGTASIATYICTP